MKPYIVTVGSGEIDRYYKAARWPSEGEVLEVTPMETYVGGYMANATCVMAGYGGCDVHLVGYAETGEKGSFIIESLKEAGVKLDHYASLPDFKTIECSIYLLNGERVIFVSIPEEQITMHFSPEEAELLAGAKFIYTNMGRLSEYDNGIETIKNARKNGALLCFDMESYTDEEWRKPYFELADVIYINDHDFAYLCKGEDEKVFCENLIKNGKTLVCVTKGKNGGTIYHKGGFYDYKAVPVTAVDTTGAGDTFNGTFTYRLTMGDSIEDAANFAAAAAARAVTIYGPHGGIATEEIVNAFLKEKA